MDQGSMGLVLFHCSLVGQSLVANLQDQFDAPLAVFYSYQECQTDPLVLGYQVPVM